MFIDPRHPIKSLMYNTWTPSSNVCLGCFVAPVIQTTAIGGAILAAKAVLKPFVDPPIEQFKQQHVKPIVDGMLGEGVYDAIDEGLKNAKGGK